MPDGVLKHGLMADTLTIQLPKPLAEWLEETAARTGRTKAAVVRSQLEQARAKAGETPAFMKLAGARQGPANLSRRKGYSRS